ncbi:MAG: MBL fold metallo-hydrolase [Fibrobacter sp.]|nr:MBL fold metallo-hydrolase [Fibrobacter sp.]
MAKIYNLGSRIVNNYLISTEIGYILIDTGYEGGFKHFTNKLNYIHISPQEIRYVVLTHAHDDHAGFLNEVLAATDAKVILHSKAIERLKIGQNSFEGGCSNRFANLFCQILALCGKGKHKFPAIRDEFLPRLITTDSEEFRALQLPFKILETPGHTADHISLLIGDKLFCGDAAMNNFPSIKRTTIWIENLQQFKQSWKTILAAAPKTIHPAHGKPFPTSDLQKYLPALDKIRLYPLK